MQIGLSEIGPKIAFTLSNGSRMRLSQCFGFIYVVKSCEKETCRALELRVKYDYNNKIESKEKHKSTVKGNPCCRKNSEYESFILGSKNLFFAFPF